MSLRGAFLFFATKQSQLIRRLLRAENIALATTSFR
jgi:hypothetical protein